jgi:hypothetical protein
MVKVERIKIVTGHAAHARFLAEVSEEPIGTIDRRPEIPSPHAYSPNHPVWDWNGVPVIIVETRHRRYEVFEWENS